MRDETAKTQPKSGRTNQKRRAMPIKPAIEEPVNSSHVSLSNGDNLRKGSPGTGSKAKIMRNGIDTLNSPMLALKIGTRTSRVSSCVNATKHAPARDALKVSIGPDFTSAPYA